MEQMYLVEIFIDKVQIFVADDEEQSAAKKSLIVKIKFGPKVQFIIKEGQLAVNETPQEDVIECDENGKRKWSRTIRVGKSYLFPSYPDTVLTTLSKFPLEIEVWNDDENEIDIFVGIGTMHWDTQFFHMLKESSEACKLHDPLSIKQVTPIFAECCCRQVGTVAFILRLSALGEAIITEFQQLLKDPESFVFRTDKAPSMFQCKRIEGNDPNFCMVGSLYETTTLEDPDVVDNAQKKIEVCTELQSCGIGQRNKDYACQHEKEDEPKKKYPIDKIRMGDIRGPCGNANCALAHKVRTYIRNLEAYKREAAGKVTDTKDANTRKICGTCGCKDDRYHRDNCPEMANREKVTCPGCGGAVHEGETCEDRKNKFFGTGLTPKGSKTTVAYCLSVPNYQEAMFGKDYIVENAITNFNIQSDYQMASSSQPPRSIGGCCCRNPSGVPRVQNDTRSSNNLGINTVYNMEIKNQNSKKETFCTEMIDECKCSPPKPSPPCKTFDCDCLTEASNIDARKRHKPYCPSYKHKTTCPVNIVAEDEDKKKDDYEEDEAEPLPYGLPPIKLGPCPILGKPCTYPDGFARMYKVAAQPPAPPSYSDAGKVCCSKEFQRIKKALKEYMKNEKDHDYRCINKFNVDTERRCCDKEQRLIALMGKGCCGAHKMAIQEKFKEEKH